MNHNWKPPHHTHRKGINIDIGKRQVKKSNREKLIRLMCKAGFAVRSEGDAKKEIAHYHLTLQPPGRAGWGRTSAFDIDPLGIDCCPADEGGRFRTNVLTFMITGHHNRKMILLPTACKRVCFINQSFLSRYS